MVINNLFYQNKNILYIYIYILLLLFKKKYNIFIFYNSASTGNLKWEDYNFGSFGILNVSAWSIFSTCTTTIVVFMTKLFWTAYKRPRFLAVINSRVTIERASRFVCRVLSSLSDLLDEERIAASELGIEKKRLKRQEKKERAEKKTNEKKVMPSYLATSESKLDSPISESRTESTSSTEIKTVSMKSLTDSVS